MPTIDWGTEIIEPAHHGTGAQLCVEVRSADASWAQRFNEFADDHYRRGEVRGDRWGLVGYNEVEGHITVNDLYGDPAPARQYLTEAATARTAQHAKRTTSAREGRHEPPLRYSFDGSSPSLTTGF